MFDIVVLVVHMVALLSVSYILYVVYNNNNISVQLLYIVHI